jgi:endoglucanase Acf2
VQAQAQARAELPFLDVYPAAFVAATPVVGMVWSMMEQEQTWFGLAAFLSNGIQMLPFTPATEGLLPRHWVSCTATHVGSGVA